IKAKDIARVRGPNNPAANKTKNGSKVYDYSYVTRTKWTAGQLIVDVETVVANFFKPASQKEPEPVTFRVVDKTLLVARYGDVNKVYESKEGEKKPRRIAAF